MPHDHWTTHALRRVNPAVPATIAVGGVVLFLVGYRLVGAGLVIGAGLAFVNAIFLYQRVELAAEAGDVGRALVAMQLGLLLTFTLVGVVTFALIKIALGLAIAAVVGFSITHLALLCTVYLTRERSPELERNTP